MFPTSTTFGRPHRVATPRLAVWLGLLATGLILRLRRLDAWLLSRRSGEPQSAEDVLAWASRIEATEPGFAGDLRAAALRSMNGDNRQGQVE